MGNQRRSDPTYIDIIQQLREGLIGRVYCARGYYASQRPTIGKGKPAPVPENLNYELWQGPAPRKPYVDNRIPYNWHWFWHWGTGELGNNGVHALDVCRWGTGVDLPTRVTSMGGRYRYEDDQETPDTQDATYEFPGGVQISYHGLSCNSHAHDFIEFYGENGALGFGMRDSYTLYDAKNKVIKTSTEPLNHTAHLANFRDAILSDKSESLNSEIAEAYKSTMMCLLGNIAQRTGRVLHCDPTNGHIQNDADAMKFWKREYEKGWEPTL
jgi:predicted dehydrogenase